MSYPNLTPQRPLPGTYFQTPAPRSSQNGPLFPTTSPAAPQTGQSATSGAPPHASQSSLSKLPPAASRSKVEALNPQQRAARTINETLAQESRYPDLDNYLAREYFNRPPVLCVVGQCRKLTLLPQRVSRLTMISPRRRHGRRFTKFECTIYQTRSSSNTILPEFRRVWVSLPN